MTNKMDYNKHPWGYEMIWAEGKSYSGLMMVVLDGEQTPYIYHKKRDKTLFILQGVVQLVIEGRNKLLREGEKYHISPKLMHRLIAIQGDVTILEVGTQIENDVVIVEE